MWSGLGLWSLAVVAPVSSSPFSIAWPIRLWHSGKLSFFSDIVVILRYHIYIYIYYIFGIEQMSRRWNSIFSAQSRFCRILSIMCICNRCMAITLRKGIPISQQTICSKLCSCATVRCTVVWILLSQWKLVSSSWSRRACCSEKQHWLDISLVETFL